MVQDHRRTIVTPAPENSLYGEAYATTCTAMQVGGGVERFKTAKKVADIGRIAVCGSFLGEERHG